MANSLHNEVVIDLEDEFLLYGFRIFDCQSGPENYENVPNYRISISIDGKAWTTVAEEKNCAHKGIKERFIAPKTGKYVNLETWSDIPFTMRMWEFEVIGGNASVGIIPVTGNSAKTLVYSAQGWLVGETDTEKTEEFLATLPYGLYVVKTGYQESPRTLKIISPQGSGRR